MNILLVEDSPADVRFTRLALEESGRASHLAVVHDSDEAIRYLRRADGSCSAPRPDLVLLDLDLPLKNGREVLCKIRTDADLRAIPVVVFTGSSAGEDVASAYRLQANCYVIKPLDLDRFVETVQAIERFWSRTGRYRRSEGK